MVPSWWKGMSGSRYMTTAVAEMMVRLNAIVDRILYRKYAFGSNLMICVSKRLVR